MFFGVDYYPEQWVFPYAGTADNPEGAWERDAELMAQAGINVVRIGEFSWGLCEPEAGQYDFLWLRRVMDIMEQHDIKVVLGTPTAAPPIWLAKKHPEILPIDEYGRVKHEGTRRAVCFNNDIYWNTSKRLVENMAKALGDHPQLIAWQIDSGLGGHQTEWSFNEDSRLEWQNWLKLKYETVERLNDCLGLRYCGQMVSSFDEVPMPMYAPTAHNPALLLDWNRFCSDAIIAFARMQADVLHEICPDLPVTVNLRALHRKFDHFDMAAAVDFVSVESNAAIKTKSSELACDIDILRSLKKSDIKTPDGDCGFWVIEQKAGQVNWQDVNSLVRPGVIRLFTYQLISRGACGVLYYRWRQSRIGNEKFSGALLAAPSRREYARLQGNQPDWRGIEVARAGHQRHQSRGRCLYSLHARQRLDAATADAAEQIFQPPRAHPAHLQRHSRPQYLRGFCPANRRPFAIQNCFRAIAVPAVRGRGGPAQTLRAKRRHARQHVQHRPRQCQLYRAGHRLSERHD